MADDVTIKIGAKDNATSVLSTIQQRFDSFGSSVLKFNPALLATGAAAGAMAAGLGVASVAIAEASNRIDGLLDESARLGTSVADLQAFQFAMDEIAGVGPEQAAQSLQKLQRLVGEIASGGNENAAGLFAQLGLDAQELSMQNPIDQFMQIRDALANIENQSERAAIAQQIFGRSAGEIIPALTAAEGEMEGLMGLANRLGITIDEGAAQAIGNMNDSVNHVVQSFGGLAASAAGELAPAITMVADEIAAWMPTVREVTDYAFPQMVRYGIEFSGNVYDIGVGIENWTGAFSTVLQQGQNLLSILGSANDLLGAAGGGGTAERMLAEFEATREAARQQAEARLAEFEQQRDAQRIMAKADAEKKAAEELAKTQAAADKERARADEERQKAIGKIFAEQARLQEEAAEYEYKMRIKAEEEAAAQRAKIAGATIGVEANQGRLITRGRGDTPTDQIAKNTEQMLKEQTATKDEVRALIEAVKNKEPVVFSEVN